MAVIIPVVSKFDDKGIKQAQAQFGQLGKSLKSTIGAIGIGIGLAAVTNGLKESAKAAVEDTKSQALLAAQLKNTVGATDAQTAAVEASISKMQLMAAVADDEIRPAFSAMVVATKDIGQATALTSLALDVAAGTGKDLGAVTSALAKAVNGSSTALIKLIPSIKGAKDPLGELDKTYKGMAETAANNDPFKRMQIIFGDIQEEIGKQLLPALQEVSMWLASPAGQEEIGKLVDAFKEFAKFVGQVIIYLKDNYDMLLKIGGVIAIVATISSIFQGIATAINLATVAAGLFTGALAINPVVAAGVAIAGLVAWIMMAKTAYDEASTSAGKFAKAQADKKYAQSLLEKNGLGDTIQDIWGAKGGGTRTAAGDAARYGALGSMGTPTDPLAALKAQLAGLQTTTNTVKKADTASANAAKKASEARAKAIADAKELADEAKRAFDELKKAIENFNDSFAKTATAFREVFRFSAPLGEFESQAVDAFQTMKDAAQEAFDNGLIEKTALANLKAYADKESALLVGIAKQRDQLAKKISIAESVTAGVMGSLNITSMLESQTKQVTKSVTKMVNGIAVTTTQTFDEVVSGGLADSFKKLVDKTKAFATNLIALKKLGLNGQLFKQIVEGGAEAGGATAEAILAGGADTVKELNGLFKDLTDAGASIAETATPVMYDLGENMTNSFIDGLRSQDQMLIATANSMAALFTNQFKSMLDVAITPGFTQGATAAKMNMDSSDFIRGYGRVTSTGTSVNGGNITVQVYANAITDKQSLPALVTDALVTASKQGLTGGLSRLLAV